MYAVKFALFIAINGTHMAVITTKASNNLIEQLFDN